jgi:plasmid stability protein
MVDLLIRNIRPRLKRRIEERAREKRHSLSAEAQALIERGLAATRAEPGLGTKLFTMVDSKYRGDDLVFEIRDYPRPAKLR